MATWRKTIGQRFRKVRRSTLPRLWSLHLDRQRAASELLRELEASPKDEHDAIMQYHFAGLDYIDEEIEEVRTRRLRAEADRFDVPVPDIPRGPMGDEYWDRSTNLRTWLLKAAGKQLIRKQIREERKARFEDRARWGQFIIQVAAALVALAGAITGVIYALKK